VTRTLLRSTWTLALLALAPAAFAQAPSVTSRVEIRVIEAEPGPPGTPVVDPRLKAMEGDFRSLPFSSFQLQDAHQKVMQAGERVSFEFPGPKNERRFLIVTAHGEQAGGKQRFQLSIPELKFDTLIAVPDGGTILVGGPKHGSNTVFFAVTAHKSVGARGQFKRR
jgi:hypothetical protein